VILLAWRDAKNYDAAEVAAADAANWEGIIRNAFSGYYRRLRRVGYGLLLTILVGTLPGFASAYVWMYPFFLTILYALYVYGWGMFKLAHVVTVLGNKSLPDEIKAARQKQDGLYVSSALLGLLIFVCMLLAILFPQVVAGWAILVMFWGGIVLLIIHLTAFAGLKELFAKPEAE
jgi:Ca2+/Na+ antiporter